MENTLKIEYNNEHNGIELYFDEKPTQDIITALKNAYFRWHNIKKCWFAKNTNENAKLVESLRTEKAITATALKQNKQKNNITAQDLQLKSLRNATPQEIEDFVRARWQDKTMQDYLKKEYDFYITKDNFVMEIEKANKLSISKTIWYDDEQDAPLVNIDSFLEDNELNCNRYDFYYEKFIKHTTFYFCKNTGNYVYVGYYNFGEIPQYAIREITADEMQDILTIYKKQKDDYVERLKKYYAKYGKHITAQGYWANR